MTRLVTCGWETGDKLESGTLGGSNNTTAVVSSSPTPRSPGAYCLKIQNPGNGSANIEWNLGVTRTDLWIRVGVYVTYSQEMALVAFWDSTHTQHGCVTWNPTDSFLKVRNGNYSGTLLGTSTQTLSSSAWHCLEVHWQISTATSGTVEVWVDGTRWLNLTGVDNTAGPNANMQYVSLGELYVTFANGPYLAVDDFAVNDTNGALNNAQITDGRVVLLKPAGAGSNTTQTRGGTDTGANWSQCSELPPSMTQYVYSATAATRDTYALEDIPAGLWMVNCVEVLAYAQNSDAGAGSLGLTLKSGAATNEGTAQALNASAAYYRQLYETDPATTAAWTNAAVNALEAGSTVR